MHKIHNLQQPIVMMAIAGTGQQVPHLKLLIGESTRDVIFNHGLHTRLDLFFSNQVYVTKFVYIHENTVL